MKKLIFFTILITVSIFLLLFGETIYHNSADNICWKQLNANINYDKIYQIILESELVDSEKSDFINNLSKAEFYKSNWRKEGPTGRVYTIVFKDGSKQYFQYWGNAIFETTYSNGQFLIKSNEIEKTLKKHGITLN